MKQDIKVVEISESWMYLTNTKTYAYEMFENWIVFFLYYTPIAMALSGFVNDLAAIKGAALLLTAIAVMIIIKRQVEKMSLFIGANLIVIAIVFFISSTILERVLLTLFAVIYFIYCFKKRYNEVVGYLNMHGLLLSAPLLGFYYIVASYLDLTFGKQLIMFSSFNTVICYAIYLHMTKTQKLLEWEASYALTFMNKVRKMKIITTGLLTTVIALFNLFLWKSGMFTFFDYIQDQIANFFKTTDTEKTMPKPSQAPKSSDGDMTEALKNLGGNDKPNLLLILFWKLLEIVLTVLIIVIFIYVLWLIYLKLKELYKLFYYKEERGNEKRESILPTENLSSAVISRLKVLKDNVGEIFERSNRKKIRRIYNKIVLKHKNKGLVVSASNTPKELQVKIQEHLKNNLDQATAIYEKARYSTLNCSDEDVENIKKFL